MNAAPGRIHIPRAQPVLRLVPQPSDANPAGDIFGGWVMSQVDIAGAIIAMRHARGRVVTVAVNSFQFKQPIAVGDLVSFYARIVKVGKTSITVEVKVYSTLHRYPAEPKTVKVTEAVLTFVAVDNEGNKLPVPPHSRA